MSKPNRKMILAIVSRHKAHGDYTKFAGEIGITFRRLMQLVKDAKAGGEPKMHGATIKAIESFLKKKPPKD